MRSDRLQKSCLRSVLFVLIATVSLAFTGGCETRLVGSATQSSGSALLARSSTLTVCSFNIQFLGNSKDRDNAALADLLKDYDLVVVQELVAPPYPGTFPNGEQYRPDPEATKFFDAMKSNGFTYVLSEEDTGTGEAIHSNGTATEWWVAFYKPDRVGRADDLPHGFLAADRSNHPDYERVPYAFAFRSPDRTMDFVLISVHLKPDSGAANATRRKHELATIAKWIGSQESAEKDFIILGDMNIEDRQELASVTPSGFISLNDECRQTNTNVGKPRPYDHVMFRPQYTTEIDRTSGLTVVDLISEMKKRWTSLKPFPGNPPYNHDEFRKLFSDHCPIVFGMRSSGHDDD